ncbi:hypothetical protein [Desulforamulus aeronauticus]|uniref:Uncharacterized protein n=1 Tax=Desulforamulus aeronauticus DSM 10349 TaxID=1121421 RepID=A0A1M6XGP4_9FIRM|nr:hypothetical protein [Desulforamulus aeronauticus]SHL05137.1 hypothetical protein SAMN02745123_04026 [Desulforamulus aeronauticus DSM 10349]
MPTITPNFGLKKPLGNEVVNRQAYNENLELLDQNAAKKTDLDVHLADYTQEVKSDSKQSVTLPHGLSTLNAPRAAQLKPKFKGRQLVNLLGRDGNCDDVGKWSPYGEAEIALDNTDKVYGNNSIKLVAKLGKSTGTWLNTNLSTLIKPNGKYILLGLIKNGSGTGFCFVRMDFNSGTYFTGTQVKDTAKFNLSFAKFIAPATISTALVNFVIHDPVQNQHGYVDGVRLYELSELEYKEIDTLTPEQMAERYPYVDSFQCVQNPAVRVEGENLLPPFSQWTLLSGHTLVNQYELYSSANINGTSEVWIQVVGWQQYTASVELNTANRNLLFEFYDKAGIFISQVFAGKGITEIVTPATAVKAKVRWYNVDNTAVSAIRNPMLVLGDTLPTEFKPYNPSHLYLQTPLYEGETLEEIDGQWMRTKKWEKKVLDGSLPWELDKSLPGYKTVRVRNLGQAMRHASLNCVKYDGKIIPPLSVLTEADAAHFNTLSGYKDFYISIANTDSGWGENYTPTVDEIKAYFMGWRMYDGITGLNYNGTGTKHWYKINKNSEVGISNTPTSSYFEWTQYQLHYQLATPTMEVVPYEGELALHEGANQVEVFEGVVVRELVDTPFNGDGFYVLNHASNKPLKNRLKNIIDIFDGDNVDFNWEIRTGIGYHDGIGARLQPQYYDPTAQYSVTYQALPEEFTAPLLSVDATYDSNIKSTVDTLVDELAKVTTDVTALEMALRNKGLLRKTPICKIGNNSVNQSLTNNTLTHLTFNSIYIDTDSFFNLSAPGKIQINTPGKYLVTALVNFGFSNTGLRQVAAVINGATSHELIQMPPTTETGKSTVVCLTFLQSFNAGDYFNIAALQTSGTSLTVSNVNLAVTKVGD